MERRKFIKTCCYSAVGVPILASLLQSCESAYYASSTFANGKIVLAKSEFIKIKKNKETTRSFVIVTSNKTSFPICIYQIQPNNYVASLLKCTHNGCELNVGGGIYSCPCHGSEFSTSGQVLEGPADRNLQTFKTESDNENIYIYV